MLLTHPLSGMLRKLETRVDLSAADRDALLALPYQLQSFDRSAHLVREGQRLNQCLLLLSGFAFRHKLTATGTRQILSMHVPGDFIDLEAAVLNVADHNVQALGRCDTATIARNDLRAMMAQHPEVALGLWVDTLIDASIFREWIVNVGRRDGRSRIAHLLCEFAVRLNVTESMGAGPDGGYEIPMTQEQLGDAAGLTAVHVNRMLRDLAADGLITRRGRKISVPDWQKLRDAADFSETYLHLDQAGVNRARAAVRMTGRPAAPPAQPPAAPDSAAA